MSEPETPAVPPASDDAPSSGGTSPPDGTGPPDGPGPPDGDVSPNRSLMIVLSYLWILALIPLLVDDKDPEVRWHARHGLVLTAAEIGFWLVIFLLNAVSGFLGCLLMPIYVLAWLGILGLHIACMVKGVNGSRLIIPGVSQYADRF